MATNESENQNIDKENTLMWPVSLGLVTAGLIHLTAFGVLGDWACLTGIGALLSGGLTVIYSFSYIERKIKEGIRKRNNKK